ncbi:MAG: ectoine synthase [Paracoccus sp. (in: a-proteobacteria)]|jgi:L-ectoine synthase|uniref:ectoine synthase n=1 Tax=unclassified Paracoccus (in: a-proteobacteria) TaxID=2688777 RepID=UPI000C485D98|nr:MULTISPECIES: ectoine synthase [unclassified Paracoccus (in: a-proteobacteria)]MAN56716.1 L-ectoine synthase [Paracoccus sp. (in: a-proteobacteria)]MBA48257.1 L-ectoine synthase [Paracoccus sp. (in: a-proteobacteria)]MCS5600679.1 ectoine synthase [Paracoccus sp. (in: a-proteobacteria)]HIC64768.1 ectoine synthase [Paracoccus sp. (in: a-proteobacteria)]|tara:strand:+ start:282 stop:674 length:393 start_codon:yes stop_codon:yes gene_type:complete
MIVRDFNKLKDTDRSVSDARWNSVRMLLADDGMGFSFHITTLEAGSEHTFHYKHHFESVYCMSGRGSITDLGTGETHEIRPGVMYALNLHDRHTLRAEEELVMACCFNPPVTGTEVHREDGSYAPVEETA